jgi:surface antigen
MALHPQAGKPERKRAGNAENWGRPSGGTDFLLAGPATALECQKKAALADGTKTKETLANGHDSHYAAKKQCTKHA